MYVLYVIYFYDQYLRVDLFSLSNNSFFANQRLGGTLDPAIGLLTDIRQMYVLGRDSKTKTSSSSSFFFKKKHEIENLELLILVESCPTYLILCNQ